jgi:hypothetical protein
MLHLDAPFGVMMQQATEPGLPQTDFTACRLMSRRQLAGSSPRATSSPAAFETQRT